MELQVSLKPLARRDLVDIWDYIARDNPDRASSFCRELIQAALTLRTFAERGQSLHSRSAVRKRPYNSYVIFYRFDEPNATVEILRFWNAARNQRRLRLKEESPEYKASLAEIDLRRHQLASGEGAVIPGDEVLLQQSQSQQ